MLRVGMLVDIMGDEDKEYQEMEDLIARVLPEEKFQFFRDLQPYQAHEKSIDLFLFDFGGLMPGADGLLGSMVRQLREMLDKLPSCCLVFWTTFTADLIKSYPVMMEVEAEEFYKLPNIAVSPMIFSHNSNQRRRAIQKIRAWHGLESSDEFLTRIAGRPDEALEPFGITEEYK